MGRLAAPKDSGVQDDRELRSELTDPTDRLANMVEPGQTTLRLKLAVISCGFIDGNVTRNPEQHFLDFVLNGTSLRERVEGGDEKVTALCRTWSPDAVTEAIDSLLGRRASSEGHYSRAELLVCSVCGDSGCGALTARVTLTPSTVTWSDFRWEYATTEWAKADGISEPLVFDRHEYEEAFAGASERVASFPFDTLAHRGRRFSWPWQWGWRSRKPS